jgi:hypothetical protein
LLLAQFPDQLVFGHFDIIIFECFCAGITIIRACFQGVSQAWHLESTFFHDCGATIIFLIQPRHHKPKLLVAVSLRKATQTEEIKVFRPFFALAVSPLFFLVEMPPQIHSLHGYRRLDLLAYF